MGRFVNPDNSAFQVALNSEIYVDKTGLLSYTNKVLFCPDRKSTRLKSSHTDIARMPSSA